MDHQYIIDYIISGVKNKNVKIKSFSLLAEQKIIKERLKKDIQNNLRDENIIKRSLERIPLCQSLNTIKIDTSNLTVDEVVDLLNYKYLTLKTVLSK